MSDAIPQTSPRAAYLEQREEIDAAVAAVLDSERYIMGPRVAEFERNFADYIGAGHAIGVANGTDALHLALRALGIGKDDVVATVANTAVATAAAIEMTGATVAFADVDDETLLMSPGSLAALMANHRVRAVVAVHLFGGVAPIEEIAEVARQQDAVLVEDCAQAHGATRGTRRAGTFSPIAAFSFYPTKNLGAIGDGGAVVTSDAALAERVRLLRQYGWQDRYVSATPGMNSRLDELQAAILDVKLGALDRGNARRRTIAAAYRAALQGTSMRAPHDDPGHVYHQFVVRTPERDALQESLRNDGIGTLIHYPVPIHLQPAYRDRVILPAGGLPVTECAAAEILSLPMFPQLTDAEVGRVCEAVRAHALRR